MAKKRAHPKLVFVVGAGASAEVELPIGRELADEIGGLLRFSFSEFGELKGGDRDFFRQIPRERPGLQDELIRTARMISNGVGLAPSIDQFIDKHGHNPHVATLGKAAIIAAILKSEAKSDLRADEAKRERINFVKLRKTWYWGLGSVLTARTDKAHLSEIFDEVAIVCFNYDRCIEQYLAHYLSDLYNVPLIECRQLVDAKLNIFRPYGRVAPLIGGHYPVEYGRDWSQLNIFELAKNIRTFTEAHDSETVSRIRDVIRYAKTIAFLGFHYLEPNMEILTPGASAMASRIFGTAFQRSEYERTEIQSLVRGMLNGRGGHVRTGVGEPIIASISCQQLFADYGLGLRIPD